MTEYIEPKLTQELAGDIVRQLCRVVIKFNPSFRSGITVSNSDFGDYIELVLTREDKGITGLICDSDYLTAVDPAYVLSEFVLNLFQSMENGKE